MRRFFLLLLLFVLPMLPVAAQENVTAQGDSSDRPSGEFHPNWKPNLDVRRAAGAITIDGDLGDPGWQGAARGSNFSETYPNSGTKPPVETEAFITYDDENLYVGFIAHDDPATIRASMHERDEGWSEDMVGIILDTYGDGARAYEIFTNARGIQGDLLWTTDDEDTGFDMVFESKSRITAGGYQVEMAIPFRSLRFPDRAVQPWKATFWRIHPRASRNEYTWAAIDQENPCQFCQYGTLSGIENVHSGGGLSLLPVVVAAQSGSLVNPGDPTQQFVDGKVEASAGLGIRYAVTPSIAAEVAINPDFSQVESDAARIDVNTTFALQYPERRPFFQEGADLFGSWIPAVYSRAINDPIVAAKIVGRAGGLSFGYLGAYDQNTPIFLPFEESTGFALPGEGRERTESYSSLLRLKQSFTEGNHLGLLVTDRRLEGGGSGSVAAIDGQVRFLSNWHLEAQVALSNTAEPNDTTMTRGLRVETFENGKHTAAFDGESFVGHGAYLSIERESRVWNFDIDFREYSPSFRTMNGIVTRNNSQDVSLWTEYRFYPEKSWLVRFSPSINIARVWNSKGVRKDEWIRPQLGFTLTGQSWLGVAYLASRELFRGVEFPGIRRLEIDFNTNASNIVNGGFWYSTGRTIARNTAVPVLGRGMELSVWATFQPISQFNMRPSFDYQTLDHPDTGENLFDVWVARLRMNYQFTRELSLRLVLQYVDSDRYLSIEPLATYKINPFTIFYAGSSHALIEYPGQTSFTQQDRQFFVKAQYLWQI